MANSPLPIRDGLAPSFLWLPEGEWPDLLSFLLQRFPHLTESTLRSRMERDELLDGAGRPLRPDSPCQRGMQIFYYREVADELPIPFEEEILYQDERLLVVDKPHFLPTIPSGRFLRETLIVRLRHKLNRPDITPIHRLDRETAGVVLFCLDPRYRGAYQSLFEQRDVAKGYEAIAPFRSDLSLPICYRSRLQEGEQFFTMCEVAGEANSETYIRLIKQYGEWAHYRLEPHTGRKHQLRAHLAALNIPILHDPFYPVLLPDKAEDYSQPLQLLARDISFIDPIDGQQRYFSSKRQLAELSRLTV